MERIIRLNAVEILCQLGIVGMNQHSLHPDEHLAPQKLTISGVSFASLIEDFLNTANTKLVNNLFASTGGDENTLVLRALLQALLNNALEAFSSIVFGGNMTFLLIFIIRRKVREIAQVSRFFKKVGLWIVKVSLLFLLEFILREQIKIRRKKAFYNKAAISLNNLPYPLLYILNRENIQIQLALNRKRNYEFMCGKVDFTYEDTLFKEKLAEVCQIELLLEGKK
jgi:hypothetical protein